MPVTIFNTAKSRLEKVDFEISHKNTTWFDDYEKDDEVYTITDMNGGILIGELGYGYPVWFDDISRADIGYDKQRAAELKDAHILARRSSPIRTPARDGRQLRSPWSGSLRCLPSRNYHRNRK